MTGNELPALYRFVPENHPDPDMYLSLIKAQVLGTDSKGKPRPVEDLLFFLNTAKRTGLDPLTRQIYAIYRWDSRQNKEKMTTQISIDGMRLIAQRSGLYGGQDDALFTPEDESAECPTKATVTVYRLNPITGERMPVTASARWREYAAKDRNGNLSGLWAQMPYLMLSKVAEALALRKAFPQELSGLYTTEEMNQANGELANLAEPRQLIESAATVPGAQVVNVDDETGEIATPRETQQAQQPEAQGWAAWPENWRKAFWAKCDELGLSRGAVHDEFGVDSMTDYTGSAGHAGNVLKILAYGFSTGLRLDQVCDALAVDILDEYAGDVQTGISDINAYVEQRLQSAEELPQ